MSIALKEARETKYWLRLLQESKLVAIDVTNELTHVDELIRMLTSIVKTTSAGDYLHVKVSQRRGAERAPA